MGHGRSHKNWKLIVQLSLFGLAMAFATVFIVPSNVEPWLWLFIFLICAYLIAKHAPGRHFLHGLMLGVANSVWITAVHILLFDQRPLVRPAGWTVYLRRSNWLWWR